MKITRFISVLAFLPPLLLVACTRIEAPRITTAEITLHRAASGEIANKPQQRLLSPQELENLNRWLSNNSRDWKTHNPVGTFYPDWCISKFEPLWEVKLICRYGTSVVATTSTATLEHHLGAESNALSFAHQ